MPKLSWRRSASVAIVSARRRGRTVTSPTYQRHRAVPFDNLAARMPDVFWIGLTLAVAIFLIGVIAGARSRTTSLRTGAAMGAYLGLMLAFPLLAIGVATI